MTAPRALTIAGSDSGGGAGIQADLKTFQELDVFGMSAITAVTAQNTLGVHGVYPMTPQAVAAQIDAVGQDLGVDALKTGMLFDAAIIEAVAERIQSFGWNRLVVDPVMIAKGGAELLRAEAVEALKKHLLPLALVVTPNIPEAEALTGMKIATMNDRREAARRIADFGAAMVVIKGGHAVVETQKREKQLQVVDLVYDGSEFEELVGERIDTRHTHGTGCTFSAAVAARLAAGSDTREAVRTGRRFIQAAIEGAPALALGSGHGPTDHAAYRRSRKL
ncbi:bifunctional hydroxymethylpyrimidine kinase/phosphomethylpyrimidine kinase [Saccharibacillus endophyticus]|uniref:Hydroxymethylpyrimidine/phosphomethylpyrimidine kinase n=1 Tax=Saccharibacillus endophyticus TaxID=2060666 RepID=A0ABQ1ZUL9_9BACL|nr:bifunctional hydroxymethylpyrimidine kinase/phosphomethylpyrimidine kinase [Saccharibacillus endophyticus]GGH76609.1 hydroxymethylpyrimidine/phosphomethylpyrimidine kinase [Saccharibacillus endophyticus]